MKINTKYNIGDLVATVDGIEGYVTKIEIDVLSDERVEVVYAIGQDDMAFEDEMALVKARVNSSIDGNVMTNPNTLAVSDFLIQVAKDMGITMVNGDALEAEYKSKLH